MKSTKQIEETAFAELRKYVELNWPGCRLEDARNKGQSTRVAIGDALLTLPIPDGRCFDIELKSSRSPVLPTNLRFTHQTISSALGRDLIVALVWNIDVAPKITFFRLGDKQNEIIVEPHFIVQAKHINQNCSLEEILGESAKPLELSELLSTEVRQHIRKPKVI
jgi:hypothetical protein